MTLKQALRETDNQILYKEMYGENWLKILIRDTDKRNKILGKYLKKQRQKSIVPKPKQRKY
jgi:hypothetical protein